MKLIWLFCFIFILLTHLVDADTPPITNVFKMKTGSAAGVLNASAGYVNYLTYSQAANSVLPSQTGNSGKVLATDGSNPYWFTAAGTGTVTNVTSNDGSIDITNPTIQPNLSIHFPMQSTSGSVTSPNFNVGGAGIFNKGFGGFAISTLGVEALEINNNQQASFSKTVTATDFIYPAKASHTFLAGPTSGSAVPSFRFIQPGDITNDDIPFPLESGGSVSAPSFSTGGGGAYSCGFGVYCISTLGTERFRVENNGSVVIGQGGSGTLTVNGDGIFTGNISAANYPPAPPSGPANTFAGYDNTGALSSVTAWSWVDETGGLRVAQGGDLATLGNTTWNQIEIATQNTVSAAVSSTDLNFDLYYDRNNTGADADNIYGITLSKRHEGSGSINGVMSALTIGQSVGNGNGAKVNNSQPFSVNHYIDSLSHVSSAAMANIFSDGGASAAIYNNTLLSVFNNVNTENDFRGLPLTNNGDIGNNGSWISIFDNNDIARSFTVMNWNHSGNIGSGPDNLIGYEMNLSNGLVNSAINVYPFTLQNTITVSGSVTVVGMNNQAPNVGAATNFNFLNGVNSASATFLGTDNNLNVLAFTNSADGYRFNGVTLNNQSNITDSITGFRFTNTGNARAGVGLDVNLTGNCTDDCGGVRVNVQNQTSTNSQVYSGQYSGGRFQVQSAYNLASSAFVEIGNNITATGVVQPGSAINGSDQFIQFFQSNLDAQNDITASPLGLNTTMNGFLSQAIVGSGKTVDKLRSVLIGTSVPSGSGGTITDHVAITVLGLPSFGGSVSNPNRIGIEDSTLLGQGFCDGATNCHFINVNDGNAQNSFAGGVQLTTAGSQPTCDAAHRGTMWVVQGGTGVADDFQVCLKDAADVYAWVSK